MQKTPRFFAAGYVVVARRRVFSCDDDLTGCGS